MLYTPNQAKVLASPRSACSGTSKKRRGAGWKRPKSRLGMSTSGPGPGRPFLETPELALKVNLDNISSKTKFEDLVDALNSCEWDKHIYREALGYKNLGMLEKAKELLDITPVSTYLEHNRASEANALKRLCKKGRMVLRWCAEATHANNEAIIPFSMPWRPRS